MKQPYQTYTATDRDVWRMLYEGQMKQLPAIASVAYLEGIEKVGFVADHIPDFATETNPRLRA
jgi:phenylalanine-4-hydroxylase